MICKTIENVVISLFYDFFIDFCVNTNIKQYSSNARGEGLWNESELSRIHKN